MTHRIYIETLGHLHAEMANLLQPHFPDLDVQSVPLIVTRRLWAYGKRWGAMTDGVVVYIDAARWPEISTNVLLQDLAHEFEHLHQRMRQGWLVWSGRGLLTVLRSIRRGSFYDHSLSSNEAEAEAKRAAVWAILWARRGEWMDMLDRAVNFRKG